MLHYITDSQVKILLLSLTEMMSISLTTTYSKIMVQQELTDETARPKSLAGMGAR